MQPQLGDIGHHCTHVMCIDIGVCPQADQRNAKREAESSGGEKNEGEYVIREPFSVTHTCIEPCKCTPSPFLA